MGFDKAVYSAIASWLVALSREEEYVQFYGPLGVTQIDLLCTLEEINAVRKAKCTFGAIILRSQRNV